MSRGFDERVVDLSSLRHPPASRRKPITVCSNSITRRSGRPSSWRSRRGLQSLRLLISRPPWAGRTIALLLAATWAFVAWSISMCATPAQLGGRLFRLRFRREALLLVLSGALGRITFATPWPLAAKAGSWDRPVCAVPAAADRPTFRACLVRRRAVRHCARSHRARHARRAACRRADAVGIAGNSPHVVRRHRRDTVGDVLAGGVVDARHRLARPRACAVEKPPQGLNHKRN